MEVQEVELKGGREGREGVGSLRRCRRDIVARDSGGKGGGWGTEGGQGGREKVVEPSGAPAVPSAASESPRLASSPLPSPRFHLTLTLGLRHQLDPSLDPRNGAGGWLPQPEWQEWTTGEVVKALASCLRLCHHHHHAQAHTHPSEQRRWLTLALLRLSCH